MDVRVDDLTDGRVIALVEDHFREMAEWSPPGSMHALELASLRQPEITFFTVWDRDELVGSGALKELDPLHGEIKCMRTSPAHLRRGVAGRVLGRIIAEARRRGYRRLSLETGSQAAFEPARQLYLKFGFRLCEPFGDYVSDSNSVFMTIDLCESGPASVRK